MDDTLPGTPDDPLLPTGDVIDDQKVRVVAESIAIALRNARDAKGLRTMILLPPGALKAMAEAAVKAYEDNRVVLPTKFLQGLAALRRSGEGQY